LALYSEDWHSTSFSPTRIGRHSNGAVLNVGGYSGQISPVQKKVVSPLDCRGVSGVEVSQNSNCIEEEGFHEVRLAQYVLERSRNICWPDGDVT
jgi:hypothetical protein